LRIESTNDVPHLVHLTPDQDLLLLHLAHWSQLSRCRSGSRAGAPRWFGESGRDGGDLQDPNVSQAGIYYPRILVSPHPKETCWMSLDDFTQASPVSITFWHCLNMFAAALTLRRV
jgi:hypothetical protein